MQLNSDIPTFITPVKSYPKEMLADWQNRRNKGEPAKQIGSLYRVSEYIILKNTATPKSKVKTKITQEMVDRWQERRNKGDTVNVISLDEGVSYESVSRHTTKMHVRGSIPIYELPRLAKELKEETLLTINGAVVGTYKPKDESNG